MGKPFKKEIEELDSTIQWALEQDVDLIYTRIFKNPNRPLFIVGSGGSLSACHYVACIYQNLGFIAKAITPLELYYSRIALTNANILFISSSGRNNDILFAFQIAIQNRANEITTICMRKNAPLTKLANSYSVSEGVEYDIPTKKDGFLATNSLIAFFVMLGKASGMVSKYRKHIESSFLDSVFDFVEKMHFDSTITVLYGGWSMPIAYDLESKFTEAALGNILLTDYRNFGHGRHHWFDKRKKNSAIIAYITPEEEKIAKKTLELLPSSIPKLIIESSTESAESSIELLVKSYHIVNLVGQAFKIDPGRPGVPEFGSKLYHLRYSSYYKQIASSKQSALLENAILKKTNRPSINQLTIDELNFWKDKYSLFVNGFDKVKFGSIVFDYDGTLCHSSERYKGSLPPEITNELIKLLEAGIIIGIATGRGQSVRTDLQKSISNKKLWKNVIIGYYNGSEIGLLADNNSPNVNKPIQPELSLIDEKLSKLKLPYPEMELKLRPNQLTIQTSNSIHWNIIKGIVQNMVMSTDNGDLQLLESSHSIDVVVRKVSNKNNVVKRCIELSKELKRNEACLKIGDKGQWPGNDYELLSNSFSLSVDEVSPNPDSCWNLASIGLKGPQATISYLQSIELKDKYFSISL